MNNGLFLQKLKVFTYPFSSFYSYKNPEFLNYYIKNEENGELKGNEKIKKEDILSEIFEDIRQGFYTTKLDSIRMLMEHYWNLKWEHSLKNNNWCGTSNVQNVGQVEKLLYLLNKKIARKYFYLKDGKLYIDGCSNKNYLNESKEIEYGVSHSHKFEWYILKHLIDMDTVIGAFFAENNFSKEQMILWETSIFTTESLLDKVLEKGIAELHMHVGAARKFSNIWMKMMNDINVNNNSGKKDNILKNIKITTLDGIIVFEHYIKVAGIIRILMAAFLSKEKDNDISFKQFLRKIDNEINFNYDSNKTCEEICDMFHNGHMFHEEQDIFYKGKSEEIKKFLNIKYEEVNALQNEVKNESVDDKYEISDKEKSSNGNSEKFDFISGILKEDILTYIFDDFYTFDSKNHRINKSYNFDALVLPEHILISKSMTRVKNNNDAYFSRILWQYIKIKNIVYKYVVQQYTSGKGLDIFSEIYHRQSSIKDGNYIYETLYSQLSNQNIRKLEMRVSPPDNEYAFKASLVNIFQAYKNLLNSYVDKGKSVGYNALKNNEYPLLGIVYHFIKSNENVFKDKCFHLYNEKERKQYMYYGKISEKYKHQASIMAKLRREVPYLANYIVGIDAASKENNTEPWVFREAYKILRDFENVKCEGEFAEPFVKNIGYTYHVGEEFRDMISGLRHVDEVIEKICFKSGDRLGHAIVVGLDIDKWAEINSVVYLPAGEYFENLLWEWGLYVNDERYKDIENIAYLENRIYDMAEKIFGFTEGITVRDLYLSYSKKFKELCSLDNIKEKRCKLKSLTKKKFYLENDMQPESLNFDLDSISWTPRLIYQALNCEYFLQNISETVIINVNKNLIDKYKKLQKYIKSKINDMGIIIETNPTSNLLIGDFTTFEDYHITNLSSPESEDVIITINTDDPVVFNTKITNEFALIYDILMKKGKYSGKEIIEWLDKIRANGITYSFIKDRGMTAENVIKELDVMIEVLKR